MTDDTALLTRALQALTYHREQTRPVGDTDEVIAALRSRLADKPNDEIKRLRADRDLEKKWRKDAEERREDIYACFVEFLKQNGLLAAEWCSPDHGVTCGNYWIVWPSCAANKMNGPLGYGKTEDEAVNMAMKKLAPTTVD